VADGERDRLRERIRDAKRRLASQGIYNGGKRPSASTSCSIAETRRLVPNAAETATIERMKAMRQDGATLRAIGAATGHGAKSVQRIMERVGRC
jgi:putative DNA-invertase from lambdoid prophage Rac